MTDLEYESFSTEETLISSVEVAKKAPHITRGRVIVAVDNLRCSAYPVEDNPEFEDPEFFEVLEYWKAIPGDTYSKWDNEILEQLSETNKIVEFRIGRHTAIPVRNKKDD